MTHAMRLASLPTNFALGWDSAIALWKDGLPVEEIAYRADFVTVEHADEFARGMRACVEAMSGWVDAARRAAKAESIPSATIDALVARALAS